MVHEPTKNHFDTLIQMMTAFPDPRLKADCIAPYLCWI